MQPSKHTSLVIGLELEMGKQQLVPVLFEGKHSK